MTYRVKYRALEASVFEYSDGYEALEDAERYADDLADAQFMVDSIQEGPYPTVAQKLAQQLAQRRLDVDTLRQRLRHSEMRGPRDFGPDHNWPR